MDTVVKSKRTLGIIAGLLALVICSALIGVTACSPIKSDSSAGGAALTLGTSSAYADSATGGALVDKGEVSKGDTIEYFLTASYTGYGDDKSGVITVTDKLPNHLSYVAGSAKITAASSYAGTFATAPSYNASTHELSFQVAGVPAGQAVEVSFSTTVEDDATSLGSQLVEYVNYASISHAAATKVSNGVRHFSGARAATTYGVTYQYAGDVPATASALPVSVEYSPGAEVMLAPAPTALGYEFSGWSITTPAGTAITDNAFTMPSSAVVVTGTWTKKDLATHTVSYAWEGLDGGMSGTLSDQDLPVNLPTIANTTVTEGTGVSLPAYPGVDSAATGNADDPYANLYADYVFLGWKIDGHTLTDAEKLAGEFVPTADVKLTGCWERRAHTVTYTYDTSAPSGATAPASQTIKWGNTFTPTTPTAAAGYRFLGWSYAPNLGAAAATYTMPRSDVTATGSWAQEFTISVTNGSADKTTAIAGETVTLTPETAVDLQFSGWTVDPTTLPDWNVAENGVATFTMPAENVTATANYSATLAFVVRNGFWSDDSMDYLEVTVPMTKQGNGTWIGALESSQIPTGMKPMQSFDATKGAWDPDPNTYVAAGSVQADSTGKMTTSVLFTYTFQPLSSVRLTYASEDVVTGKVVLNNAPTDKKSSVFEDVDPINSTEAIGAEAVAERGYHFSSWTYKDKSQILYDVAKFIPEKMQLTGSTVELFLEAEYTAHFTANTYDVVFDKNAANATGDMPNQEGLVFGTPTPLNANAYTRTDAQFLGWNSAADGSGTFYANEQEVSDLASGEVGEESATLYAQWRSESATDTTNQEVIAANNFSLRTADVAGLNNAKVIAFANATAHSTVDGSEIAITQVDYSAVKAERGTYDVTFKTAAGTSVTVTAQVYDTRTEDTANKERISANNFMLGVDEVAGLTDASTITLANAKAISTVDGTNVDIASVDRSRIKAEKGIYTVIFKTAAGASVTVYATVYDKKTTDDAKKETIAANDFRISIAAVAGLTDSSTISEAQAKAVSTVDGAAIEITSVDRSKIKAEKGTYPVTFATAAGTSVTVNAIVYDVTTTETDVAVAANAFSVSVDEVISGKLGNNYGVIAGDEAKVKLIELAQATAWKISDRSHVDMGDVWTTILAKKGTYNVRFWAKVTRYNASALVPVTVTDKATEANGERITANNFRIAASDVASMTDASTITLANASAHATSDGANVAITSVDRSKVKAEKGTYEVTMATAKGTSVTVNATVYDQVDTQGNVAIAANAFSVSVDEVTSGTLNDGAVAKDKLIELAQAAAWKVSDGSVLSVASATSTVQAAKGTYDVTFTSETVDGDTATVTVPVTVTDKATEANGERISANNFRIAASDVAGMTDASTITLANATAHATSDGANVAITSVDRSKVKAEKGTYDVTFKTAKGTSVTVTATVYDKTVVQDNVAIAANAFSVSVDEIKSGFTTPAKLVELAQATAWRVSDNSYVAAHVERSSLVSKKGTYPVVFTSDAVDGKTASVTIDVTVTDKATEANGERISANNFRIAASDVAGMTDQSTITLANASAHATSDGANVAITSVDRSKVKAEKGTYPVTLATTAGTSVTVNATVYDKVVTQDNVAIAANAFSVSVAEVTSGKLDNGTTAKDKLIELAQAAAWRVNDGADVAIATATSTIKAAKGTYDVTFTSEAVDGKTASVTVPVTVTDEATEANGERITANNFRIAAADVASMTDDSTITLANATAHATADGANVAITSVDRTAVKAEKGTYPVTFKTAAGTSVTVNATVYDKVVTQDNVAITANNFSVSVAEVTSGKLDNGTTAKDKLIELAQAEAWKVSDGADVAIATAASTIQAVKGTYDVTFTSAAVDGKTASITITVTVTDKATEANGERISANDFRVATTDVAGLTNDSTIALANATAHATADGANVAITNVDRTAVKAEKGTYPVTFATAAGTSVTVNAIVYDKADTQGNVAIAANAFSVSVDEVTSGKLDNGTTAKTKLIELAQAKSWKVSDGAEVSIATVTSTIKAVKGAYDVTFTSTAVDGKTATVTVPVTVTDKATEANGERISANDFRIATTDVAGLTDASAITLANATAHATADGANVAITSVDRTQVKAEKGTYEVTFATAAGTSVTVNAIVYDKVDTQGNVAIAANAFSVSVEEVTSAKLNDGNAAKDRLIELAQAAAWKVSDGSNVAIASAASTIQAVKGTYQVTFTSDAVDGKTASVTIDVTVTDKATEANNERISANDFRIATSDVAGMTDQSTITLANATAHATADGANVAITSVDRTKVKAEKGTYPVTFKTAAGTSVTVNATVYDKVVTQGNVAIAANAFSVSVDEVTSGKLDNGTTAKDKLIELAQAAAWKVSDGSALGIVSATSTIQAIKGTYEVTFTSETVAGDTATVTVPVTVTDKATEANGERISANDFRIATTDVAGMTDASTITLANATAHATADGANVAITSVDRTAVKAEKGTYEVTFATAAGTSVTVNAIVYDKTVTQGNVAIAANAFSVSVDEVTAGSLDDGTASKDRLIELAQAAAWKVSDGSALGIASATSTIQAIKGTYEVTFTSETVDGNTATVTVPVTVTDKATEANGERISANNFRIATADVAGMTDASTITLANATAHATADGANVAITSVDRTAVKAEKGTYPVTFKTAAGTSVTVSAVVYDKTVTQDNVAIAANTFSVSVDEVTSGKLDNGATAKDRLIELAQAAAWKVSDGSSLAITSVTSTIQAAKGTYQVTFTSAAVDGKTASVTIDVTVTDKATEANGERISANDFMVAIGDVAGLTDQSTIARANATAHVTADGANVAITNVDRSAIQAAKGTYEVTFATAAGTSVTVNAVVYDKTVTDETNKEMIGADDFRIATSDVAGLTDASAITLAHAKAVSTVDGANVEITNVDRSNVKAEKGTYEVTFATAKGTSVTVNAIVYDKTVTQGNVAIAANAFSVSVDEVTSATLDDGAAAKDKLIELAQATAWKVSDSANVTIASATSTIQAVKGTYDVTFTSETVDGNTATVTVPVTVTDKATEANGERISANNFRIATTDVAGMTDASTITLANATAHATADGANVAITSVDRSKVKAEKGTYEVTFKTAAGTSVTVNAIVYDKADTQGNVAIAANAFSVSVDEVTAGTLNDGAVAKDKLIELAQAAAWKVSDGSVLSIVNPVSTIQAAKGTYDVTFTSETVDGNTATVTVPVTVTDKATEANGERISANNFRIATADVAGMTDASTITLANATAHATVDGANVAITSVDRSAVKAEKGTYPVTFKTAAGTSVTVNAIVYDKTVTQDNVAIAANAFSVSVDEVTAGTLNDGAVAKDRLIELAQAAAWKVSDGANVTIASATSTIQAAKGTYQVTFASAAVDGKTASVTIDVTVTDKATEANGERISANSFMVSIADVANLTDDSVVSLAHASAHATSDGANVAITSIDRSKIQAAKGTYEVTFATAAGTSVTVNAVVYDETTTNTTKNEIIGANDFRIAVDSVSALDDATAIDLARAKAESTLDGANVAITVVDRSKIKDEKGTYPVTFKTAAGTSVTVNVMVYDKVVTQGNVAIAANAFSVAVDEVTTETLNDGAVSKDRLIELAQAAAWRVSDSANITIVSATSTIQAAKGTYDVTFTSEAVDGNTATVTVPVTVTDKVTEANGERISANNFLISVDDVAGLDKAKIISLAGATAHETVDGTNVAITSVTHSIEAVRGTYEVTFATAAGTSVTVNAIVYDKVDTQGNVAIAANGFSVSVDEVSDESLNDGAVSKDRLIALAQAKAWRVSDSAAVAILDPVSTIQAAKGTYDVTFTSETVDGNTATVTVPVTVTDKATEANNERISANDFRIAIDDVADLTDESIIERAHAEAHATVDGARIDITSVTQDILEAKGTYPVTFATEAGTSVTINAIVYEKALTVDDVAIAANGFVVSIDEVTAGNLDDGTVSKDRLIELAQAAAWRVSDSAVVAVDSAESTIKAVRGTYEVTFTSAEVEGSVASVTVPVLVSDHSIEDPTNHERISTNDFSLSIAEAQSILQGGVAEDDLLIRVAYAADPLDPGKIELIRLARAQAISTLDGSEVPITSVVLDELKAEKGAYGITFATEAGTSITSTATVTDNSGEDAKNGERILANDIEMTYDEAGVLLAKSQNDIATELATRMTAYAYSTEDGSDVEVVKADWNLVQSPGVHEVTFYTEKGTKTIAHATVGPAPAGSTSKTGDDMGLFAGILALIMAGTAGTGAFAWKRRTKGE